MDARIVCGPFTFHVRANEGALIYFVTEPTGRQERRTGEAQKRTVEAGDSKLAALTKGQQQEMESKELKEKLNKYAQAYNELKLQHTDIKGKLGTKEDELSQQKKDFSEAYELRNLEGLVRNFSKQNAVGGPEGILSKGKIQLPENEAAAIITNDGWEALKDSRRRKTAPWLLMSAWLSRYMCHEFFMHPFLFLDGFEGEARDAAAVVWDTFRALEEAHGHENKEVSTTRSEMIRLFNPLEIDNASGDFQVCRVQVSEAKSVTTGYLASVFMDLVSSLLKDGDRKDMARQLREIFGKAVQVSTKLTTQRSSLMCKGLRSLPSKFDHNSKEMEAHWLHNNDLEDDEAAVDGKPILLVTQPAIVAIGKSDGSDYSSRRVLKKAIVWMG